MLGPLLFIIFINDFSYFNLLSFFIYADDTNAILSHPDLDQLTYSLNSELSNSSIWLKI